MKKIILILLLPLWLYCNKVNESGSQNLPPTISVKAEDTTPAIGSKQKFTAEVSDPNPEDSVTVSWTVTAGEVLPAAGLEVLWTAPKETTTVKIVATARDLKGSQALAELSLPVGNTPPKITAFSASSPYVISGNSISLSCTASDAEGGNLFYQFIDLSAEGLLEQENLQTGSARWTSPILQSASVPYNLVVVVTDEPGFYSTDTLEVLVYTNYGSVWVVDNGHRTLTKYTTNGIKVLTSAYQFVNPVSVVSNSNEPYGCFVADQGLNQVIQFNAEGEKITIFPNLNFVSDIALHQASRKVWAISYGANSATVIDVVIGVVEKTIAGFVNPTSIEINQRTGDVWILEEGNNRVIQLNMNQGLASLPDSVTMQNAHIFREGFNAPHRLCVHNVKNANLTTLVYLADLYDDQIERIFFDGSTFQQLNPVDLLSPQPVIPAIISLNLKDYVLTVNNYGRIELFEEENIEQKRSLSGNYNFIKPVALYMNERTNECWVGDTGTNQLVKIKINSDYTWTVLRKISGFLAIKDLAVNQ